MTYTRTAAQRSHDFANAREYEEYVSARLGVPNHTRFDAKDDLDIWVPGYMVEVKEKNQPLTDRWHLYPGVDERDLFVLDELTVRKALRWYPAVFYLIRDNAHDHHLPKDERQPRLFLAPVWELVGVERVRVDRSTKGKWIIDLQKFRRLSDEADIPTIAHALLVEQAWKRSPCQGGEVPQVRT